MNKDKLSELLKNENVESSFREDIAGRELIMVNGRGLPLDEFRTEKDLVDYILKSVKNE